MSEFRVSRLAGSFEALLGAVRLEDVTLGRRGAILVAADARGVPIVRSTTPYRAPAQPYRLALDLALPFNNAMVEHYTGAYRSMKHHSDQALDLADGSEIALVSFYRDPARPSRRLLVQAKEDGAASEVPLDHGSIVAFSLATNRRFTHAIALRANAPDNEWLGITLRTSKTFVRFAHGPTIDGVPLTLADEAQRRELYQLRRRENTELDFVYPPLAYTLSDSDRAPPS